MTRSNQNSRRGIVLRSALYLVLALVLCVSTNLPFISGAYLNAFADEEGGGAEQPIVTPKIMDVGIYWADTSTPLGFASNSSSTVQATITSSGGVLEFDSIITWTDWSENGNHSLVHWQVDNSAIASITDTGILTAHSDGLVKVMAIVYGADTEYGTDLIASTYIQVSIQSNAPYVTDIQIADESNNILGDVFTWSPTLGTDIQQFYAVATVYDPSTDISQTYSTINGPLSAQVAGISDVIWYVGESDMGSILETGEFRPEHYGGVSVHVVSNAGQGGAALSDAVFVQSYNPDPGDTQSDGYFPQDTLKIRVYYAEYTPAEYGDDAYVIEKEYSVDGVEALGTETSTFTALGGTTGYYTMTGRGVRLSSILQDAGVDLDEVISFDFQSKDGNKTVSKEFVFTPRYYYRNMDIGSSMERYWEPVQVYPMIALESAQREGGSTEPIDTLLEATRFRLLFGAVPDVGNSEYQRKWIHTIDVVYAGAPAIETPGGPDDVEGNTDGSGTGEGTTGDGSGAGGAGSGVSPSSDGSNADPTLNGGVEGAGEGNSDPDATSIVAQNPGTYSVYQMMSNHDNTGEISLDFGNPFKQFALPVGATVFIAGGIEMLLWYRRQTQQGAFQLLFEAAR